MRSSNPHITAVRWADPSVLMPRCQLKPGTKFEVKAPKLLVAMCNTLDIVCSFSVFFIPNRNKSCILLPVAA